jgi:hypothetical protein
MSQKGEANRYIPPTLMGRVWLDKDSSSWRVTTIMKLSNCYLFGLLDLL